MFVQAIKLKRRESAKKKKKLMCYDCIYSSRFTSDFSHELPPGYVYCRKWKSVVGCSAAKVCPYFERFEKRGKKRKLRRKRGW